MGAIFGVLLLLFPRRWIIALAITACIASTRVFVGAHYPSDTVAGFGLGLALAVISGLVFARLGFIFAQTGSKLPVRKRTFRLGPSRSPGRRSSTAAPVGDGEIAADRTEIR